MQRSSTTLFLFLVIITGMCLFSCNKESTGNTESASKKKVMLYSEPSVFNITLYTELEKAISKTASNLSSIQLTKQELSGKSDEKDFSILKSAAASQKYDLIITATPRTGKMIENIANDYPTQQFLTINAPKTHSPFVHSLYISQKEQAFLLGYLGGLVTKSNLEGINSSLNAGLLVVDNLPLFKQEIEPGFSLGLKTAHPGTELYIKKVPPDANETEIKSAISDLISKEVDVILPILDKNSKTAIDYAKGENAYILWLGSNAYPKAPITIVGCITSKYNDIIEELFLQLEAETLSVGSRRTIGIIDGYIEFLSNDINYKRHTPDLIKEQFGIMLDRMKEGRFSLR